ncbi:hypothetical protein PVK06_032110 [Gossypium arboreum]|uniref:Uncharacterized protein n=1 Tax=Gossypium arboreum TaxID=29729 RepID=A0ABR0NU27_GOSAR|nr:hypothetical protein PVK06_032110 [Gossypium arboreum]
MGRNEAYSFTSTKGDSNKRNRFKYRPNGFDAMWLTDQKCKDIITRTWETRVDGYPTYRLMTKMKVLQGELKKWNKLVWSRWESNNFLSTKLGRGRNIGNRCLPKLPEHGEISQGNDLHFPGTEEE